MAGAAIPKVPRAKPSSGGPSPGAGTARTARQADRENVTINQAARAKFRADQQVRIVQERTAAQKEQARQRKGVIRQTERSRKRETAAANQQRIERSAAQSEQRVAVSRQLAADRTARAAANRPTRTQRLVARGQDAAVNKTVSTLTPSSNSNLIMTTIFVMFGLVIFYVLVTASSNVQGFFGTLGNVLHGVSSTTPLFKTTTISTTPATTTTSK